MTEHEARAFLQAIAPTRSHALESLTKLCVESQERGVSAMDMVASLVSRLFGLRVVLAAELRNEWTLSYQQTMSAEDFDNLARAVLDKRDELLPPAVVG